MDQEIETLKGLPKEAHRLRGDAKMQIQYARLQSWSIFLGIIGIFILILEGLLNFKSIKPTGIKVECRGIIAS